MLALLIAANSLAASGSATLISAPERATVTRSRIRTSGQSGPGMSEPAGEWGRIGLGNRLSSGSAIPEPGPAVVREPDRGFPGVTIAGPTGLMLVPSARVLKSGWWSAGLHRGVIKGGMGVMGIAEAGVAGPDIYERLRPEDWGHKSSLFLKMSTEALGVFGHLPGFAPPAWRVIVPVLAGGIENSPKRDAETAYGAATWDWSASWIHADLHAGWGTGRFMRQAFLGLGVVPTFLLGSTLKLTGEYAGQRGISGIRFAISRNLRMDFGMEFDVVPRSAPRNGWSITTSRATLGVCQSGRITVLEYLRSVFAPRKKEAPRKA